MNSDAVVIIPARISSRRLERKMLQMIGSKTMIEHVLFRINRIKVCRVFVATDSEEIFLLVNKVGGVAIMTEKNCLTGTDRVHEALKKIPNYKRIKYIVSVQADMPFIDESIVLQIIRGLKNNKADMMTAVVTVSKKIADSESNVKVVIDKNNNALYFSRSLIPNGSSNFLYHLGIYGFRLDALERFVSLEQSRNEKTESLEQLRALDNGISIGVCHSKEIPISVDTEKDLELARQFLLKNSQYLI